MQSETSLYTDLTRNSRDRWRSPRQSSLKNIISPGIDSSDGSSRSKSYCSGCATARTRRKVARVAIYGISIGRMLQARTRLTFVFLPRNSTRAPIRSGGIKI
uniref:Uncharacterized protein n=1 Tax=Trichogramma kaykai TaxID=54128 RepID=A0ABD2WM26_9HYME